MLPLLLLAGAALAQGHPTERVAKPTRFAVPVAVDHVAVMSIKRGYGPPGEDRATVKRSGSWVREEQPGDGYMSVSISNLSNGISLNYRLLPNGAYQGLSISGGRQAPMTTIRKTDQTDRLLDETCTVWLFTWNTIVEKNCLTSDGILLWQRVEGRNGAELSSARAESISRRTVTPAEVRVPSDLLQLSTWDGWSNQISGGRNDEVLLLGAPLKSRGEGRESLSLRRLGAYAASDEITMWGRRRIYVGRGIFLNINEAADGSLERLDVSRLDVTTPDALTQSGLGTFAQGVPLVPARAETVLGQKCDFVNLMPGVMDVFQYQCRTADGIALQQISGNRGFSSELVAKRLVRGKLSARDVMPPADVLSRYLR